MELDFAEVKPSLLNWAIIGLMAVTFIAFAKFVSAKWSIPGVSDLVGSI